MPDTEALTDRTRVPDMHGVMVVVREEATGTAGMNAIVCVGWAGGRWTVG